MRSPDIAHHNSRFYLSFQTMIMRSFFFFSFLLFALQPHYCIAQSPTFPEQECTYALPICGKRITQPNGYPALANFARLPAVGAAEFPVWYSLEAAITGRFAFTLTPNDMNDDYDWAVYDVTEKGCDLLSQVRPISFNLSGRRGVTGANSMGTQSEVGLASNGNPFSTLIPLQAGRKYLLLVIFTPRRSIPVGTNSGFTLDFIGTADGLIAESPKPRLLRTAPITGTCGVNGLRVTFSEPIAIASVQARDLVLYGLQQRNFSEVRSPSGGRFAQDVQSQGFERTFDFIFDAPVTMSGRYTLAIIGTVSTACSSASDGDIGVAFEIQQKRLEIAGTRFFCRASPTTLSVPNEFESYRWTNAAGQLIGEKATVEVATAGVYTIEASVADCRVTSQATIALRENLSVQISGSDAFCDINDDCAYIVAEEGFTLYEWLDSTGTVFARRRDVCVRTEGTYRVRASINGCEANSRPLTIRKRTAPTVPPTITRRGNMLSVVNPQPDALRIEWRRIIGDGLYDFIRVGYDSTLIPQDTGRYTVALLNAANCAISAPAVRFQPILASVEFRVGSVTAVQNDRVGIPILLTSAQNLAAMGIDSFRVHLRCNARLLFPEDENIRRYTVQENERFTQITMPIQPLRGDTLGIFTFRAMLGNTSSTVLSLQDLNTIPPNLGLRMSASNGLFTLVNIATEGSVRLIERPKTALSLQVRPNPTIGQMGITVIIDSMPQNSSQDVRITITDVLGRTQMPIFSGVLPNGEHQFTADIHHLPTGSYMVLVQTPDQRQSTSITILH